jgi:hypothetical protein
MEMNGKPVDFGNYLNPRANKTINPEMNKMLKDFKEFCKRFANGRHMDRLSNIIGAVV